MAQNRLAAQKSAYLRQHADNPVDWYPWCQEAFDQAKKLKRPIFLSIGYFSCHWCHVMEREVFRDHEVAAILNRHFVCIKVDREERPDLDAVYLEAVQRLRGSAGWPLSVFLTEDGRPFYGGTYFPKEEFIRLISSLAAIYADHFDQVATLTQELRRAMEITPQTTSSGPTTLETIGTAAQQIISHVDRQWGGLGQAMKFPQPVIWRFLLHYYRKTADPELGRMITLTLDRASDGGLFDHLGGGFHRYCTDRIWLVPHFEKMLYDNAQLAELYLEAAVVFDNQWYASVARSTFDFMIEMLASPEGGFAASCDADTPDGEGAYYLWGYDELFDVLGHDKATQAAQLLGVTPSGNYRGRNVLSRRSPEGFTATQAAPDSPLPDEIRIPLRAHRNRRRPPAIDKKIITSWNGLAIAALARGFAVLRDPRYAAAAIAAAEYIWHHHRRVDGTLYRSSYHGHAENEAVLEDYALLAAGLIELFIATANIEQLKRALGTIQTANQRFAGPNSTFYMAAGDDLVPFVKRPDIWDEAIPSGGAMLLFAMLKAAALTGQKDLLDNVRKAIAAHGSLLLEAPMGVASWLDVALMLVGPHYSVNIYGDPAANATQALVNTVAGMAAPYLVWVPIADRQTHEELGAVAPSIANQPWPEITPSATVCSLESCFAPTDDPSQLRQQLLSGWRI